MSIPAESYPDKTILILNDHPSLPDALKGALEREFHCKVIIRETAEEALKVVQGANVDLIISDVDLGGGMEENSCKH